MKIKYIKIIILMLVSIYSKNIIAITDTNISIKDTFLTKYSNTLHNDLYHLTDANINQDIINHTTNNKFNNFKNRNNLIPTHILSNNLILKHKKLLKQPEINSNFNNIKVEETKKRFKRSEQKNIKTIIYNQIHDGITTKNTEYTNSIYEQSSQELTQKLQTLINDEKNINDVTKNEYDQFLSNKITKSDDYINNKSKTLYSAISGSIASSSIPYVNNKIFSVGLGIGSYKQYNALAAGMQYKMNRNVCLRLHMTLDNHHNIAIAHGIAIRW